MSSCVLKTVLIRGALEQPSSALAGAKPDFFQLQLEPDFFQFFDLSSWYAVISAIITKKLVRVQTLHERQPVIRVSKAIKAHAFH